MSEQHKKNHKKNEGNHDDCDDCKRQKKENEALIGIYQKLQNIQKKSSQVKEAVAQHQIYTASNRSFYKSYEQRIVSLPKQKNYQQSQTFEKLGFDLAASFLEKEIKSQIKKENLRLKELISQMQRQNKRQSYESQQKKNSVYDIIEKRDSFRVTKLDETFNSTLTGTVTPQRFENFNEIEKVSLSENLIESVKQNTSTQSSSFNLVKSRNIVDLSKYNDLNLWLYQNENHNKLQEELFLIKEVKNRKKKNLLPNIFQKK